MILVAGATGKLGHAICRRLLADGYDVRGMVRLTSNPKTVAALNAMGVQTVVADLKDYVSLKFACHNADTVISTASALFSTGPGDTIMSVDRRGHANLIDAARIAGAGRFVYISAYFNLKLNFPLALAKQATERHLIGSGMAHTILRPVNFMETWLSPALGFDYQIGRARLLGDGNAAVSWISVEDVAAIVQCALHRHEYDNCTLDIGGPEALSMLDVIRTFENLTGMRFATESIGVDELRMKIDTATDPLSQSIAALELQTALGATVDMAELYCDVPLWPTTVPRLCRPCIDHQIGPSFGLKSVVCSQIGAFLLPVPDLYCFLTLVRKPPAQFNGEACPGRLG